MFAEERMGVGVRRAVLVVVVVVVRVWGFWGFEGGGGGRGGGGHSGGGGGGGEEEVAHVREGRECVCVCVCMYWFEGKEFVEVEVGGNLGRREMGWGVRRLARCGGA